MAYPLPSYEARTVAADDFVFADHLDGITAVLGGAANVIMQLSWAPVAYGVMESKVHTGSLTKRPIKRTRTTITYLAVAMLGTDADRVAYREAVNTSHRQVRSGPDSPVKYNAFSRDLQLWVGACLYRGVVDTMEALHGQLDEATADSVYAESARLATTLQVPLEMWPPTRADFDEYWHDSLSRVSIDDRSREYLMNIVMLRVLPRPLGALAGPLHRFVVTGFLPQQFRDEMRLPWTAADQRRFDRLMRVIGAITRRLPGVLRRFPMNFYLRDMRTRMRLGRPLV